jgi:hypothetical protein
MIVKGLFSLQYPFSERALIFFHYYHICVVNDTIVVHLSNSIVKSKVLQAGYLSKNVMQDTSFVNAFWKIHLLNCNVFWFVNVGFARIYNSVSSGIYFFPLLVMSKISERIGQQL